MALKVCCYYFWDFPVLLSKLFHIHESYETMKEIKEIERKVGFVMNFWRHCRDDSTRASRWKVWSRFLALLSIFIYFHLIFRGLQQVKKRAELFIELLPSYQIEPGETHQTFSFLFCLLRLTHILFVYRFIQSYCFSISPWKKRGENCCVKFIKRLTMTRRKMFCRKKRQKVQWHEENKKKRFKQHLKALKAQTVNLW